MSDNSTVPRRSNGPRAPDERALLLSRAQGILQRLSPQKVHELVERPAAFEAAVKAALYALNGVPENSAEQESRENAGMFIGRPAKPLGVDEARSQYTSLITDCRPLRGLLSVKEFAERTGVKSKQTIMNWIDANRVVAWRSAKKAYVLPVEQLDEAGRPLNGLKEILPYFENGYLAWVWLTHPLRSFAGQTPLACLKHGEIDKVTASAAAFNDGAFG
jgi:hypothetical protein